MTNEVFRPAGISWTGFAVMWVVWMWDGMETRHAAEAASISKATLTGVVKTVVAKGWMEKRSRIDDRRLVELRLTPAGRDLMEDLYPRFNAIEAAVVKGMSSQQKQEMTSTLCSVVNVLEGSQGLVPVRD